LRRYSKSEAFRRQSQAGRNLRRAGCSKNLLLLTPHPLLLSRHSPCKRRAFVLGRQYCQFRDAMSDLSPSLLLAHGL
jgi:hypothetical protein